MQRLDAVGAENLKADGAAGGVKPFAATVGVTPALEMHAFGVFAHEQVGLQIVIGSICSVAFQMGLAACVQVGFVGVDVAVGAFKD